MKEITLGDAVVIAVSGESGTVIGKASYLEGGDQYQVHYADSIGCAKTEWLYGFQIKRA